MPEEDARYHMKRCVDSGLWKPATDDPDTNPEDGFKKKKVDDEEEEEEEKEKEEPVYQELSEKKEWMTWLIDWLIDWFELFYEIQIVLLHCGPLSVILDYLYLK